MSPARRAAAACAWFWASAMLIAACEDKNRHTERIAGHKAAMGLETSRLSYRTAMKHIIEHNLQGRLERIARSGGVAEANTGKPPENPAGSEPFEVALDTALRVENLLGRADWAEFKGRNIDPAAFDALVRRTRDQADDLARAAAGQNARTTRRAAKQLLSLCQSCHQTYR